MPKYAPALCKTFTHGELASNLFVAGDDGVWHVERIESAVGESLPHCARIAILDYLPVVARRLYQSRELGEPFDFMTWFEYAPEHAQRFEELVGRLRATEEWTYVEREVDIRLTR